MQGDGNVTKHVDFCSNSALIAGMNGGVGRGRRPKWVRWGSGRLVLGVMAGLGRSWR